jgi:Transcriptional Coactivator p15 (PC4)
MYRLSERYALETRKEQDETVVVILNNNTGKFIEIPAVRWASFLLMQVDIDEAVNQLLEKKTVNYFEHFGGGYFVSVSTGIPCVDLRRFYKNDKDEIKPTKQGLALRISEWKELMNQLPLIMSFEPQLLVACPCAMKESHLNDPNIVLECRECSPFGNKSA